MKKEPECRKHSGSSKPQERFFDENSNLPKTLRTCKCAQAVMEDRMSAEVISLLSFARSKALGKPADAVIDQRELVGHVAGDYFVWFEHQVRRYMRLELRQIDASSAVPSHDHASPSATTAEITSTNQPGNGVPITGQHLVRAWSVTQPIQIQRGQHESARTVHGHRRVPPSSSNQ